MLSRWVVLRFVALAVRLIYGLVWIVSLQLAPILKTFCGSHSMIFCRAVISTGTREQWRLPLDQIGNISDELELSTYFEVLLLSRLLESSLA